MIKHPEIAESSQHIALLGYIVDGHHLNHCKILIQEGFCGYFLFTGEFHAALQEVGCIVSSENLLRISPQGKSPRHVLSAVRRVVKMQPVIREVFSTSLDEFWLELSALSFFRLEWINSTVRFSGIWIASNFFYLNAKEVKRKFVLRLLSIIVKGAVRSKSRILFFNEELYEFVHAHFDKTGASVFWCPDPYEELTIPENESSAKPVIPQLLMAGHHKPRKGTQWALESLSEWSSGALEVLIVGKVSALPDLESVIARLPSSVEVRIVDRRVSDEELEDFYKTCTAVLLPYRHFGGSSGIFVNALFHGKPVISSNWGIIGSRTKRVRGGLVFDHDSSQSFCESIKKLLAAPEDAFDRDSVRDYLQANSPQKYTEVACAVG